MGKIFFLSVLIFLFTPILIAEIDQFGSCPILSSDPEMSSSSVGGVYKPASNSQGQYFKVLIVFAQFSDDTVPNDNWPLNQLPVYSNNLIDQTPSTNYRAGTLSDYWKKMSRGNLVTYDFIGDVYPELVMLPSAESY